MPDFLSLKLTCDGVPDSAVAVSATVVEAISRPTYATVELYAGADVDVEAPIGAQAQLTLELDGEPVRTFHLVVSAMRFEGSRPDRRCRYVVELVHELSLLSLRHDVRMFQEKDA